jgi:hypothetical protein
MQYTKRRVSLAFSLLFVWTAHSQPVGFESKNTVHFALWALSDAIPGSPEASAPSDNPYAYAAQKIRETAPFLIEGMVYGWKFTYTPSDIQRGVEEFFSFEPILTLSEADSARIQYTHPWQKDNRVSCWIDFEITPTMRLFKKQWESIDYRRIKGRGFAPLTDGFDGIKAAAAEALKIAVRDYARGILKNKPKEAAGNVLVVNSPVIGINAGRDQVELEFYLELTQILPYIVF